MRGALTTAMIALLLALVKRQAGVVMAARALCIEMLHFALPLFLASYTPSYIILCCIFPLITLSHFSFLGFFIFPLLVGEGMVAKVEGDCHYEYLGEGIYCPFPETLR